MHRRFALLLGPALAAAALAGGAGGAEAAPIVENFHNKIGYTVPDDFACGIAGSATVSGVESFQVLGDGTAKDQLTLEDVFTSAATGKSVDISVHVQNSSAAAVLNPDGSTTVTSTEKGLLEQIKLPDGGVLTRDAGTLTFVTTYNADGSFQSSTLVGEDGPHPNVDSGYTAACDAIVPALS